MRPKPADEFAEQRWDGEGGNTQTLAEGLPFS